MDSKKLLTIVGILVVVLGVGWFTLSGTFNIPVPQTFDHIYKFTSDYEVVNLSREDSVINSELLTRTNNYTLNNIDMNGNIVNFAAAQFNSGDGARDLFIEYKKLGRANVQRYKASINIPWFGSYWTVTSNGKTYSLWRKNDWVVFMMGKNREAVKNFEKEFKNYLK